MLAEDSAPLHSVRTGCRCNLKLITANFSAGRLTCVAKLCGAGIACPSSRKPVRRDTIPISLHDSSPDCRRRHRGQTATHPLSTFRHGFLVQRTIGLENLRRRPLPAGVSSVTARRMLVARHSRFFLFPGESRLSDAIEVAQQPYRPDSHECHEPE